MSAAPRLGSVRTGITMIYVSLVMTVLGATTGILLPIVIRDMSTLIPIVRLLGIAMLGANALSIAGKLLCLSAPRESGARHFIVAAVVCDTLAGLIAVAGLFVAMPYLATQAERLLSLAGFFLFILFLKQLALFVNRKDLARLAASALSLALILTGIVTVTSIVSLVFPLPILLIFAGFGMIVYALAFVIRYLGLLGKMRLAV